MRATIAGLPSYFLLWLCAIVICVGSGIWLARRRGFPSGPAAAVLLGCTLGVLLGSKLMYVAETWWFPFDDYLPVELRSARHGFRIPGGILLLSALAPLICRCFGMSWRRFGDVEIPFLAVALVFIRAGCFLNGCCFGRVSTSAWAIRFPPDSWVFRYHAAHGWVPLSADWSLPVHPLQIYFALAALIGLVVVLSWPREASPGQRQIVFYTLFFTTTALLEPLRANRLHLNALVVSLAAVIFGATLAGSLIGARRAVAAPLQ